MPYVPRAAVLAVCPHCGVAFSSRHLRRKYCCNSCNVLAAQARQKAASRPAAPVPVTLPAFCALPERFVAHVGPVHARTIPRHMDPREAPGYAIGPDEWIQGYQAESRLKWLATRRGEVYLTSAFWVSSTGYVWVRGDAGLVGDFIHVNDLVGSDTRTRLADWGPFHGREPGFLDWE